LARGGATHRFHIRSRSGETGLCPRCQSRGEETAGGPLFVSSPSLAVRRWEIANDNHGRASYGSGNSFDRERSTDSALSARASEIWSAFAISDVSLPCKNRL